MWLLNVLTYQLEAFEGDAIPPYAILSHRWEEDEVLFADVIERRHEARGRWTKIKSCCDRAHADRLYYVWADTCCIDKKSSAELSEAINSMFRWYQRANVCYAYLCDVNNATNFTESEWFTRGWTLQELLAPTRLLFLDKEWKCMGSKSEHLKKLSHRTGVSENSLRHFDPKDPRDYGPYIAQIMSWAAGRQTTRTEDRAYSLMGLFNVNMPLLYGEGSNAFSRLQHEIMKNSNDMSIFAWQALPDPSFSMLTLSPDSFAVFRDFMALSRPYNIMKYELVVVHTDLLCLTSDIFAMPIAYLEKYMVCVPLRKSVEDSGHKSDRTPNQRYSRVKYRGNYLVFVENHFHSTDFLFPAIGGIAISKFHLMNVDDDDGNDDDVKPSL